ncbi:M48 metallopeptidase family protein [Granulicoccus phenolivorans]|uniref:M48 metallopeptidase family protein n=1 Tax=Granulicoccus phenolivorans TaxID=266854 RepID=UPI0003F866DE|nr:M48 family metallopeptidase [Granulicoccus phenolivorans]
MPPNTRTTQLRDVLIDGELHAVEFRRSTRRRRTISASLEEGRLVLAVPAGLGVAAEDEYAQQVVPRLLKRLGRTRAAADDGALRERAEYLVATILEPATGERRLPAGIRWVGNQRRRWGSCSIHSREIRISDRVRPMPDWVLDYVLVHELAHLYESGHTRRFWNLVGRYPETERAKAFLEGWAAAVAAGEASAEQTSGEPAGAAPPAPSECQF